MKEGKRERKYVEIGERCYPVKQIAPRTGGRVIKAARDVHARDRHVFHSILFKYGMWIHNLLIIVQALRPAKKDCWARRFHDSPPAKKDWDALRCSCRALRELVGSCITMAVITPSCKHPASFPSHAIMTQLCIKEKYGVSIFGFEVRNALLMLNPSEPSPASTSRIEAVEVHFTDVSGAHMSFCACLGYH